MKRHAKIASVLVVVAGVMLTTSALAQYNTPSPNLPPPAPYFGPPTPFTFESAALTNAGIASVYLYDLQHIPGNLAGTPQEFNAGLPNEYYQETFHSTLRGMATATLLGGGTMTGTLTAPVSGESVTVDIYGYTTSGATGGWNTSLSILNWPGQIAWNGDGTNNIWLQCQAAPGYTTVETSEPGYAITSYFDVTPQISLDDSVWTTADQSGDMTLVPEPSSLALLCLGVLSLAIMTRGKGFLTS